jgi:hypothetical protein
MDEELLSKDKYQPQKKDILDIERVSGEGM